jgi:hypothetical protein
MEISKAGISSRLGSTTCMPVSGFVGTGSIVAVAVGRTLGAGVVVGRGPPMGKHAETVAPRISERTCLDLT